MKILSLVFFLIAITMALGACSGTSTECDFKLEKEGIAPFELTERESILLQSFGMQNNSQIISFKAPKEAISLIVNVYYMKDGSNWESIGGGAVSIGKDRQPIDQLEGTFTMLLKDNYAIEYNINCGGRGSYKSDGLPTEDKFSSSMISFLREFQEIELNKEIPVALLIYDNGSSMESHSLEDYLDPSKFEGMDFVQAVTLTFSEAVSYPQ